MAPDAKTFAVLQTSSTSQSDTEYIPRDDESEAARLAPSNTEHSFLDAEDVRGYSIGDFGLGMNPEDYEIPRVKS